MNQITILGRVGKDPEVKQFDWGQSCRFSVAVDESYKKDGEKISKTQWFDVSVFPSQIDFVKKFIGKGLRVLVAGNMRSYETDKDGTKSTRWELIAQSITPIDWPEKGNTRSEEAPEQVPTGSMEDDGLPF